MCIYLLMQFGHIKYSFAFDIMLIMHFKKIVANNALICSKNLTMHLLIIDINY